MNLRKEKFNVFSAKSEDANLEITTFFMPGELSYFEAFGAYELITGEAMNGILETKSFMVVPADEVIEMNALSEMISKSNSIGKHYLDDFFKIGNQLEPVETDEGVDGGISQLKDGETLSISKRYTFHKGLKVSVFEIRNGF